MAVVKKVFIKLNCRCGYQSVINIFNYDREFPIACARCSNAELAIMGITISATEESDNDKGVKEADKYREWEQKYDSAKKHI